MNNDLVQAVSHDAESARTLVQMRNGTCLSITVALVRFARDIGALADPLGNGMRGVVEIPADLAPRWVDGSGFLAEQAGGAIILHGGTTLLIKPFVIELYGSGLDALHGRDCRGKIDLAV